MKLVVTVLSLLATIVLYQNCAKNQSIVRKEKAISQNPLFSAPDSAEDSTDTTTQDVDSNWQSLDSGDAANLYPEYFGAEEKAQSEKDLGSIAVIGNSYESGHDVVIDFVRTCSTIGSQKRNNLLRTKSVELKLIDIDSGEVLCQSNNLTDLQTEITTSGRATLNGCNVDLNGGNYKVEMRNDDGKTLISNGTAFDHNRTKESMNLNFTAASETALISQGSIKVLIDANTKKKGSISPLGPASNCDESNSPLAADFRSDTKKLFTLSAPNNGVHFDLLGDQALPVPHTPIAISWITDSNIAFLTLPNNRGEVNGIDQLFGDNTIGPDHRMSKHGFHALYKYDGLDLGVTGVRYGKRDLIIDKNDDVFQYLRFWFDRNLDGRVQNGELRSLDQVGVAYIDLRYDPRFHEVDQFGNRIVYKSVVGMKNGSLKLIFDIWFAN